MRLINHATTGALIGLSLTPLAAVPIAFTSHFLLDAVPHYGPRYGDAAVSTKLFTGGLLIDMVACVALVLILIVSQPWQWLVACLCSFVATLPDVGWLPGYLRAQSKKGSFTPEGQGRVLRFAKRIQWFEKPIGVLVEVAWFVATVLLLLLFL